MEKNVWQKLLKAKMTRKEFLFFLISAVIGITGILHIPKIIEESLLKTKKTKIITSSPGKFGNGPYGGAKT